MFDFQIHKIQQKLVPYFQQFYDFVDAVQNALNSNLDAINDLEDRVGAGANDNIGDIRITSGTLPASQYLGAIPYPGGLTNLSKETYADLYATPGFSGTDSALWTPETSGVTGDISAIIYTGVNYIAYGQSGLAVYSLDGSTWNDVGDIGGTAPSSAVNAAAYNSLETDVVIVVGNGNYIGASADYGKTITVKTLSFVEAYDIKDIKEFGGFFYIVGTRVVGSTYYSAAASFTYDSGTGVITWLTTAENIPGQYSAIQHDGTTYVMIAGNDGATAATARSSDGTTWTTVGTHTGFTNYNDIIFVGGAWVVVGSKDGLNGAARYSVDSGETWVTVETGAKNLNFVRYDSYNSQFVFGGADDNGSTFIYTWQNGDPTATPQNIGASTSLNDYAENGSGQSVIVGNGGTIYSFNPFGGDFSIIRTVELTGDTATVRAICRGAGSTLAAIAGNYPDLMVYESIDEGATWTLKQTVSTGLSFSTTISDLTDIEYDAANGKYIILANNQSSASTFKIFNSPNLDTTFTQRLDSGGGEQVIFGKLMCINGTCITVNRSTSTLGGGRLVYRTTDGGDTWTGYLYSTMTTGNRYLYVANGRFFITNDGTNQIAVSETGASGTWTDHTVTGDVATSNFSSIGFVGGEYVFAHVATGQTAKVFKSVDLTTWTEHAITGGEFSIQPIIELGDVLFCKIDASSAYSRDGVDWTTIDPSGINTYKNTVLASTGILYLTTGDTVKLSNYTPNVVSGTFDIPWPYPSQTLAAPYSAYIKWN